jgi:hypothetical protein
MSQAIPYEDYLYRETLYLTVHTRFAAIRHNSHDTYMTPWFPAQPKRLCAPENGSSDETTRQAGRSDGCPEVRMVKHHFGHVRIATEL